MIQAFGTRPDIPGPIQGLFARPFELDQVAVVQFADRGVDWVGYDFLVMPRTHYEALLGDPFMVAERAPPPWDERGSLPLLEWPAEPLPHRTVAQVREVLQRIKVHALPQGADPASENFERTSENSESPALLGGAQVLVEGGRLVFERPQPDTELLRGLWLLLPNSNRCQLWPASFAFSNQLRFDALVIPHARGLEFEGYTTEERAVEYPEGYYELNLQIAAEAGDQEALDALFQRRSARQVVHLYFAVLLLSLALVFGGWLMRTDFFQPAVAPERPLQAAAAAGMVGSGDPWTALGIYRLGKAMWSAPPGDKQ